MAGFLNECFDRVFCISMEKDHERRRQLDFAGNDITFVPGYDGTGEEWIEWNGRIGCFLSHYRALFSATCKGERCCVFEDDIIYHEGEAQRILHEAPEWAELIFLGCGLENGPSERRDVGAGYEIFQKGWHGTYGYGFTTLDAQRRWLRAMGNCPLGIHWDTAMRSRGVGDVRMWRPKKPLRHNYHFESRSQE